MRDLLADALQHSAQFSELCSALYEREIQWLAKQPSDHLASIQGRLKSLPYYIKRTAGSLLTSDSPLTLDLHNASWQQKQATKLPDQHQSAQQVSQWYLKKPVPLGLVVPVLVCTDDRFYVILDCIDRIDSTQSRIRLNVSSWYTLAPELSNNNTQYQLLKPTKKAFAAACSGHQWQGNKPIRPRLLSLRELLLSCQINWQDMRKTAPIQTDRYH